ncbi:MAG: peptide chain release factor N(5)-glutamine methyltransferase [Leptospira sp.]|nr:peptide chain release factor N(5)-glutamine methyltransferase [Leptospira sp.]NCS92803.1 peptide chain release factor N(5)-glutamine methyltransferase [Leptospira sp.]
MEENTLLYFIKKSTSFLEKKGIPSPRLEAEILISFVMNLSRIQLYAKFDMPLTEEEKDAYRQLIVKRSEKVPSAYLLGKKDFYNSTFLVNEAVLIPRPETEELVDFVLKNWIKPNEDSGIQALDLCSGSGCIGISVQKARNNSEIFFLDVSASALEVCKTNYKNILPDQEFSDSKFIESDFWKNWNQDSYSKLDFIFCNPPYVLPEEESILSEEVQKEPRLALIADDFLASHEIILLGAYSNLKAQGKMILETHPKKVEELIELGKKIGFETNSMLDLSKKERFVIFSK